MTHFEVHFEKMAKRRVSGPNANQIEKTRQGPYFLAFGLSFGTNPISLAQFVLEILAKQDEL